MMLIFLLLSSMSLTSASQKICDGIKFGDIYYEPHIIKEGINNIQQLALNTQDNTLYFIFDKIKARHSSTVGYYNLDTNEIGTIDDIKDPKAISIDEAYNNIYIGGSNGIYKLNDKKVRVKLPLVDESIESLHFKGVLYYTNGRREAYKYVNGNSTLLHELQGTIVDSLAIDKQHIFFIQDRILFRVQLGTRAVNIHEHYTVNHVMSDHFLDKVYVCATDGVYTYNPYKYALEKIFDVNNVKAITFTRTHRPIYIFGDKIMTLKPQEACSQMMVFYGEDVEKKDNKNYNRIVI